MHTKLDIYIFIYVRSLTLLCGMRQLLFLEKYCQNLFIGTSCNVTKSNAVPTALKEISTTEGYGEEHTCYNVIYSLWNNYIAGMFLYKQYASCID